MTYLVLAVIVALSRQILQAMGFIAIWSVCVLGILGVLSGEKVEELIKLIVDSTNPKRR